MKTEIPTFLIKIFERPIDNEETRLRNRPGLVSESGFGGSITFRYKDGFKVTINLNNGE